MFSAWGGQLCAATSPRRSAETASGHGKWESGLPLKLRLPEHSLQVPCSLELSVGETVRLMTPHIFRDDALHTLLLSWYFLPLISGKCVRVTKSQQEGSESKGTCCQVRQHEFDPQNPHYGRRETICTSCSLTYLHRSMPMHTKSSSEKLLLSTA